MNVTAGEHVLFWTSDPYTFKKLEMWPLIDQIIIVKHSLWDVGVTLSSGLEASLRPHAVNYRAALILVSVVPPVSILHSAKSMLGSESGRRALRDDWRIIIEGGR